MSGPLVLTGSDGAGLAYLAAAALADGRPEVVVVAGPGVAPSDLRAAVRTALRAPSPGAAPVPGGERRAAARLWCPAPGEPLPDGPPVTDVWCLDADPPVPVTASSRCAGARVRTLGPGDVPRTGPEEPGRGGLAPGALVSHLDRLDDLLGVVADRVVEPALRPRAAGAGVLAGGTAPAGTADLVAAVEDAHRPGPPSPPGPASPALAALAADVVGAGVPGPLPPRDVLDRVARVRCADRRRTLARDALRARAAARRRRIAVRGGTLDYLVTGSGPPVVVLEALGHDLAVWHRLIGGLATRRRVLAWAPRSSSRSGPPLLADQVDDVEAVLAAEGLGQAAFVGWCTGPKVAMAWEDREPARRADALVMLNPSFRVSGRPDVPDTPHECNLETLCRSVVSRPRSATALRRMVSAETGPAAAGHDEISGDDDAVARVLSAPPPALAPALRLPFADDASLIAYAVQLLDFWGHDALAGPPRRPTPTLVVSGDRDTVAGPAALATALPRLPHARHVAMPGGSHHLLHDRADVLARLLHEFLDTVPSTPTSLEDR